VRPGSIESAKPRRTGASKKAGTGFSGERATFADRRGMTNYTEYKLDSKHRANCLGFRLRCSSVDKLCESRLSAHMIEDRALTGKQYESLNGVQLFRVEAGQDSISQLYRKFGLFFL
jgi:hypothetical protein